MYFSLLIAFDHLHLMYQEGVSTASVCGAVISLLFAVGSMMILTRHKAGLLFLYLVSAVAFFMLVFLPGITALHPFKITAGIVLLNMFFSLLAIPLCRHIFVSQNATDDNTKKDLQHTASSIMMKLMIAACLGGAVHAMIELISGGSHEVWLKVSTLLLMALSVRLLLWRKSMGLFALYASAAVCVVMRSMIQGESVGEAVIKSVWLCASTLFITYLSYVSAKEPDTSPK